MDTDIGTIGIVGGTGALGGAIAHALLASGTVAPERLWLSNRSGKGAGLSGHPGLTVTADTAALASACDTILLAVPPAAARGLDLPAAGRLVVSVMAGIPLADLEALSGSRRVVRAMSSPAAGRGLAYSPWTAAPAVTEADAARITRLFAACGATDRLDDEAQVECFTALTGPVPGFVALFAATLADYAEARGVPAPVADRAVRQLFLGAGTLMAEGAATPADHVREMIDYAGTTAAGLEAMRAGPMAGAVAQGLDAALARTRTIARS